MLETAKEALKPKVRKRIWLISDLQQHDPVKSEAGLRTALIDYRGLDMACDAIWYLGDAIEGTELPSLERMSELHVQYLQPLGTPLRYVMGNHDLDLFRNRLENQVPVQPERDFPFLQTLRSVPGWRTTDALEQFYFVEDLGDFAVVFFSDHACSQGSWWTTHGALRGDTEAYPHTGEAYREVREQIAAMGKPVITAAHYALAGGARPSELLNQLLPLPDNVRLHIHGHSHIGDRVWGGKDCFRKVACVDFQSIPQVNISSLENDRGSAVRSAFLEIYEDFTLGIWFRNHQEKTWEEAYFSGSSQS